MGKQNEEDTEACNTRRLQNALFCNYLGQQIPTPQQLNVACTQSISIGCNDSSTNNKVRTKLVRNASSGSLSLARSKHDKHEDQFPVACGHPYYIVRAFGEEAFFWSSLSTSYPLMFGRVIINVTLVSCNDTIGSHSCLPIPTLIYSATHQFPQRQPVPYTWRCDAECTTTIPTRFQTNLSSPMGSAFESYYFDAPTPWLDEAVCFMGASHAERMQLAAKSMGMNRTRHLLGKFARELHSLANASRSCSRTILHPGSGILAGQSKWSHQFTHLHSMSDRQSKVFKRLSPTKLIIVSNNYLPLGKPALACPPTEWRRPDL